MYLTNNKSIKLSNRSTTMEMFESLGTNEKRAVNRLLVYAGCELGMWGSPN